MIELTVNGLPCVAVTPEIAARLGAMGENHGDFNWLSWPAGASNYAESVVLMHSDDATKLATGDRTKAVTLLFSDDTQTRAADGQIKTSMYQIEHRPIHILAGATDTKLVAVRMVDARYFWTGVMVNDGYNMTTNADRSAYYTVSEATGPTAYTYATLITLLLTTLGIAGAITVASASGTPNDQLINGERACDALDRVLAAVGLVLYAYPSPVSGKSYCIDTPSRFNTNTTSTNDRFVADRIAGGVVYTEGDATGRAWLNAIMPSSVQVLFPRQIPTSAGDSAGSSDPPVLRQYFKQSSMTGKPAGVIGRAGYTTILHDTLWALGPIGSETNTAALAAQADAIATAYYARFKANHTACRLKGWAAIAPIPGEIIWRLTPAGPYTDVHTNCNWGIYGGDVDVVDGFNRKRVSGLGGIQTFQSFDGSLYVSGTGNKILTGQVFASYASNLYWGKSYGAGTATGSTPGTLASAADCLVWNTNEAGGSNTGNDVLATNNVAAFPIAGFTGPVMGSAVVSGVTYPVVVAAIEFAGCAQASDLDGGDP